MKENRSIFIGVLAFIVIVIGAYFWVMAQTKGLYNYRSLLKDTPPAPGERFNWAQRNIIRGQSVSAEKVAKAKELRKNMTAAEKILWHELRTNKQGWHFRRQQIIHGYIVDFYCHQKSVIVEIDGEIHEHQIEEDRQRENALKEYGFKVIRFKNEEVERNLYQVLAKIRQFCEEN